MGVSCGLAGSDSGSRQVVAHCRADERIIQMQLLCPAWRSQKWRKDNYAVQCQVRPNRKPKKTKQKATSKNHTKKPKTTTNSKNRGVGPDQKSPRGRRMPLNWDLAEKQTQNTSKSARSSRRCPAKHSTQQRRNLGSLCQDPGDRAEKPSRHKTSSQ